MIMVLPQEVEKRIRVELDNILERSKQCWEEGKIPKKYVEKIVAVQEPEIRQKYETKYLNQKYGSSYVGLFYENLFHYHLGDVYQWRNYHFWNDMKDLLIDIPELQELAIEKCRIVIGKSFMEAVELVKIFGLTEKHMLEIYKD